MLKTSHVGNLGQNVSRQLLDGHWVLAFPSAERAWAAKQLIDQHTARLRAFYCDLLTPLWAEVEVELAASDTEADCGGALGGGGGGGRGGWLSGQL